MAVQSVFAVVKASGELENFGENGSGLFDLFFVGLKSFSND